MVYFKVPHRVKVADDKRLLLDLLSDKQIVFVLSCVERRLYTTFLVWYSVLNKDLAYQKTDCLTRLIFYTKLIINYTGCRNLANNSDGIQETSILIR